MNNIDEFLDKYKTLENILREKGFQVIDIEAKLSEDKASKLKYCRMQRNFLAHEKDGRKFVNVSDESIAFIEGLIWELDNMSIPVKKKYIPINKALTVKTPLLQAIKDSTKKSPFQTGYVPVFENGKYIGCFHERLVSLSYTKGITLKNTLTINAIKDLLFYKKESDLDSVTPDKTLSSLKGITKPVFIKEKGKKEILGYIN